MTVYTKILSSTTVLITDNDKNFLLSSKSNQNDFWRITWHWV